MKQDLTNHTIKPKRPLSVVDRRLASGAIFSAGSMPLPAKEPERWVFREVNTQVSDQHLWSMQAEKGWTFASADDFTCDPDSFAYREQDGRLVKGAHGYLILMKMPARDYERIQARKAEENRKNTFGQRATKQAIVAAAASEPDGGRGAEFLDRNIERITIKDSRERINLDEAA